MYIAPIFSGNIYSHKNIQNRHSNIRQNNRLSSPVLFKGHESKSTSGDPTSFLNNLRKDYGNYPVPEVNTPSKQQLINDGMKYLPEYTKLFEDGDVIYKKALDTENEIRENVGKILKENGLDIDNFENIDKETTQKIIKMTLDQGKRPDKGYGDNPLWLESKTFPIIRLKFEYYMPEHDNDKALLRLVYYTTEPDESKCKITIADKSKYTDKSKSVTYDYHKNELRINDGAIFVKGERDPMQLINGSSVRGKLKTFEKRGSTIYVPKADKFYCYDCTDKVDSIFVTDNIDRKPDNVLERNKLVLNMSPSETRTYTISEDGKTLTGVTIDYKIQKNVDLGVSVDG